jgi:hypothetical protein
MSSEAGMNMVSGDQAKQILNSGAGEVAKAIGETYGHWLSKIGDLQKWPPLEVARRYQAAPAMLAFLKVLQESPLPQSFLEKAEAAFNRQGDARTGLEAAFHTICAEFSQMLNQQESAREG